MSTRYEWFDADSGFFTLDVVPGGTQLGEHAVDEGRIAVVISGDEVTVIEGSPKNLLRWLSRGVLKVGQYLEGAMTPTEIHARLAEEDAERNRHVEGEEE